jgi:hypothetical protein
MNDIEKARKITAETLEEFVECARKTGMTPEVLAAAILRDQLEWSDPVESETAPTEAAWRRSPSDVAGSAMSPRPGSRPGLPELPGERRVETSERPTTTSRRLMRTRNGLVGQLPGARPNGEGGFTMTMSC